MRIEKNRSFKGLIFVLCMIFLFQGCAMLEANRKKKEEKMEEIKKQKEHYTALLKDLQKKKVGAGTSMETFEEKYGKPQDTFGSSSGTSNFMLWSYEYPDSGKEESFQPVRLYFNDGKLTYWTN